METRKRLSTVVLMMVAAVLFAVVLSSIENTAEAQRIVLRSSPVCVGGNCGVRSFSSPVVVSSSPVVVERSAPVVVRSSSVVVESAPVIIDRGVRVRNSCGRSVIVDRSPQVFVRRGLFGRQRISIR